MSCPFNDDQLAQLKAFIEVCKTQPLLLQHPKLSFFKDYLVSLGVTLPTATFGTNHFTPSGDGYVTFYVIFQVHIYFYMWIIFMEKISELLMTVRLLIMHSLHRRKKLSPNQMLNSTWKVNLAFYFTFKQCIYQYIYYNQNFDVAFMVGETYGECTILNYIFWFKCKIYYGLQHITQYKTCMCKPKCFE